ncbi:MAG: hypothetical protein RI947_367 [Candidatus Parcubacteria bacterium]|jgi:glycosyltransferase involved in cell wall biosynthesis
MAIVYDWMDKWGGVERVLQVLHEMYPHAVFYTSYYDRDKAPWARSWNIQTSFIDRLPSFIKHSRVLSLGLYPYAFESFDFSAYDTVLSVTSSFAKGIITRPGTRHISYLLTPTRYLWVYPEVYFGTGVKKAIGMSMAESLRGWDYVAAQRPDAIISLSNKVAERCLKYYRRSSEVIYPPFDMNHWAGLAAAHTPREDYYLVVSRLEPYKKVELVIEAFNNTPDRRLVVVGKGTREDALKTMAGSNISFLKDLTDKELATHYKQARAVIMMQEEDFGYVSLEAQMFGCPVITYKNSGVTETIVSGKTGFLVEDQTVSSLSDTLEIFHTISYNYRIPKADKLKIEPEHFAKEVFMDKIDKVVNNY